jgi:NAD(P)H-nitrite reductase large subunit
MRHVIIGGSIAGISAARAIRIFDAGADITMVSAETAKPYYRPMITSVIEKGDVDIALDDDPVGKYRIRMVLDRAEGLDPKAREVRLASGGRLRYDKLLLATGSSPVMPLIPGLQGPDVYPLRTLEDAKNIQAAAKDRRHAVVLGGGFVGIKAAVALRRIGLVVTILDKLDRLLSEKLDQRGSSIITELLRREEIDVVTKQQDYEIVRLDNRVRSVRLASGRIIDADMIVVAVGTKPNVRPFRDAGLRINSGIVVAATLETSLPDVFAAGDVVEYRDTVSNALAVSALWTNAEEMGRLAGKNMAGASIRYEGFLSLLNSVDILNVPISTMGLIDPKNNGYEVVVKEYGNFYRKLVFKNDVLAGALFIGGEEKTGVYAQLIKNRLPLGRLKSPAIQGTLGYVNVANPSAVQ